jgi:hypothetical protein
MFDPNLVQNDFIYKTGGSTYRMPQLFLRLAKRVSCLLLLGGAPLGSWSLKLDEKISMPLSDWSLGRFGGSVIGAFTIGRP